MVQLYSPEQVVDVEGRTVKLTNLDKVLWPEWGYTKADLLDYHVRMSQYTLPFWQNRALTVTRYPNGIEQDFFYQKNKPASAPEWVISFLSNETDYIVPHDLSTITWLVNQAAIEFHPSTYTIQDSDVPSFAIIDLDPTPPLDFAAAREIAKRCKELLTKMGLRGYPKTSGATGIHIYVPLIPIYTFDISSGFVQLIGTLLRDLYPDEVTLERLVKNRRGVYVDYLQNLPGKTIAGVYSPRPTPNATVSTPFAWNEIDSIDPQDFTIKTVPERVSSIGDLFAPVLTDLQSLDPLLPLIENISQ